LIELPRAMYMRAWERAAYRLPLSQTNDHVLRADLTRFDGTGIRYQANPAFPHLRHPAINLSGDLNAQGRHPSCQIVLLPRYFCARHIALINTGECYLIATSSPVFAINLTLYSLYKNLILFGFFSSAGKILPILISYTAQLYILLYPITFKV